MPNNYRHQFSWICVHNLYTYLNLIKRDRAILSQPDAISAKSFEQNHSHVH